MKNQIIKRSVSAILVWIMLFFSFSVCYADEQNDKSNDQEEFPMDPSVMKPWINSNLKGMVQWDVTEDYKDDFYYAVNHDWLRDAHLKPGENSEATINAASEMVDERCMSILNDSNLTGDDADLIRNYYELWLDWDGRNKAGITASLYRRKPSRIWQG